MKHLLFLLLLPCCVKAQSDTAHVYSRSSNPDGTVWLTTTDPRITLEYIGTETIQPPLAIHRRKHYRRKKVKQLILCGAFTKMDAVKQ
jgi:hypothetical protein